MQCDEYKKFKKTTTKKTAHQSYPLIMDTLTAKECVPILHNSEVSKIFCDGGEKCR